MIVVGPTPRFTWWPLVTASASVDGVTATVATASVAIAVTVVVATLFATLAVYVSVSASKAGESVTPLSASALSVASVEATSSVRARQTESLAVQVGTLVVQA